MYQSASMRRSDIARRDSDKRRSLEDWEAAESLPSHRADYLFARAEAYAITAQYDLAIADYDEATSPPPHAHLGDRQPC